MRATAWLETLLGVALATCPAGALALDFPLDYVGTMNVTATVTNANGSGQCFTDVGVSVTLDANGTVRWQNLAYDQFVREPAGLAPTCEFRVGDKTVVSLGTHDGTSRISIPAGLPTLPPITATFDAEGLRGTYQVFRTTLTFDLPSVSHRIALEPDPAQDFQFQESILRGRGFKIVMRDPHGRDHLDLGTLKILVGGSATTPGVDTTAHALSRVSRGIVPLAEESSDSRTRVFKLMPDPTKLMQGHDIFAIPFNGDWRIELRICDKAQQCFGSVYNVFFGPFVRFFGATDARCSTSAHLDQFNVIGVVIGNAGIDTQDAAIYVGLTPAAGGELWTLSLYQALTGDAGFVWWQGRVAPFVGNFALPSGMLLEQSSVPLPILAVWPDPVRQTLQMGRFPSGKYTFITAALDPATGAYRRVERPIQTCP